MKLNFKVISLLFFALAIECLVVPYILNYWLGYYGWSAPNFMFVLYLLGLILPFVQGTIWLNSLALKSQRLLTTIVLVGILALKCLQTSCSPENMIMYGLRDRIVKNYSLDDIRKFAHDFDRLPNLSDPKTYTFEDLTKTGLEAKYPFLMAFVSLHHRGPDAVQESDNVVYISGSRLQGGVYISAALRENQTIPPGSDAPILRASNDIILSRRD